uniref:Uncharacterized protein n=1 Tax=Rhizophora mucronata TaxID=61149 RepID=A0A2P2NMM2_RHIMU
MVFLEMSCIFCAFVLGWKEYEYDNVLLCKDYVQDSRLGIFKDFALQSLENSFICIQRDFTTYYLIFSFFVLLFRGPF